MFISKYEVTRIVEKAIESRTILLVDYEHTKTGEKVQHKIAPFDVGSSNANPKIRERNSENLYAYSYTHRDNDNFPNPKVCAFNINNFFGLQETDESFDENELSDLNLQVTKYDYRNCNFALLPNRNWFQ